ncbi:MAG: hypothetical protein J6Y89_05940 [Lachnospiraceae bacterium]|nr:hypothetical protein [Lachnospiraceae bacterium]
MKFCFGDIVVVNGNEVGVVVKSWEGMNCENIYDVYCRMSDTIENFKESEMERYMVRHKFLDRQEMAWNRSATG